MRVAGFDPSLRSTGWSIVIFNDDRTPFIEDWGLIQPPTRGYIGARLDHLHQAVRRVVESNPDIDLVGVEQPIFARGGVRSALSLAQAHGCLRTALWQAGLRRFIEASPISVKLAACGNARASKEEVASGVAEQVLLPPAPAGQPHKDDLTDAAGVAIYAHQQRDASPARA